MATVNRRAAIPHILRIRAGVVLGMLFLIGPISDLARANLSTPRLVLVYASGAAFAAGYLSLLPPAGWVYRILGCNFGILGVTSLAFLASAALTAGAPHSFVALYVYVAAAAGMLLPTRLAAGAILLVATGVAIGSAAESTSLSAAGSLVLTIVAIGGMTTAFARKIQANRELEDARDELADLAVSEERLRIARDLHDLLGHSLSVISLKSELAAKLIERDGALAAAELADVQAVARQALSEVREAVQGYRQLALDDAVESARTQLAAAGIDLQVEADAQPLPIEVESVLAWAVREGATNVVRHSGASTCTIRVHAAADGAALEIEDDGSAATAATATGSGLLGLAERAESVRGILETGGRPEGGFRLRLTVPLPAS